MQALVPLVRRLVALALVVAGAGLAEVGVSYADGDPLGIRCSVAPGADLTAHPSTYTWKDISHDLALIEPITFKRGTADEEAESFSELTFALDDPAGRYGPGNPESDLYPDFDVNCPIRLEVNPGDGGGWRQRCVQYLGSAGAVWPGRVMTPHLSRAYIVANGMFRRLGQGEVFDSPLRRALTLSSPLAYWPLEDGEGATQAASGLSGGTPMTVSGEVTFGKTEGAPAGTAAYADTTAADAKLYGPISTTGASSTEWRYEMAVNFGVIEMPNTVSAAILRLENPTTGNGFGWDIYGSHVDDGGLQIQPLVGGGSFAASDTVVGDGEWHWLSIRGSSAGGGADTRIVVRVDDVEVIDHTFTGYAFSKVVADELGNSGALVSHAAFWAPWPALSTVDTYQAFRGHVGEMAHERIERTCTEEGVPVTVTATRSTAMGAQPRARLLDILRDCEQTDHGILDDSQGDVTYIALSEIYNQSPTITIDGAKREIFAPFAPIRDDQKRRTRVKASRPGGSSAVYDAEVTPAYEGDVDVNTETDGQLFHHAAYVVAVGTVAGYRYPSATLDLLRAPQFIGPVLASLRPGKLLRLTNPPKQHPKGDVDLIAWGWTETITGRRGGWTLVANTTRADPYVAFVIEGSGNLGRLDTKKLSLAAAYEVGDTSLSVASTGLLASTAVGDYPVLVDIAGECVRVDSVTGAASPQTFTVTRSINGVRKRHTAGTKVTLWRAGRVAL